MAMKKSILESFMDGECGKVGKLEKKLGKTIQYQAMLKKRIQKTLILLKVANK
jgi:hypothetical protein